MWHRFHKTTQEGHEDDWLTDVLIDTRGDLSNWKNIPKQIVWNGQIRVCPERLEIPLKRRKDTVFAIWNDWCHENVSHTFRANIVNTVNDCPQHTILALTKRPNVALDFTESMTWQKKYTFPENWWTGLTVCNQQEADEKIPVFLQVPGKKFLSIEPMLGPIDINEAMPLYEDGPNIDAVILGGETGPGARPMHPDWVRSVRDQCAEADVPFFFKQWGEWVKPMDRNEEDVWGYAGKKSHIFKPDYTGVYRVGKRNAGRLLDGRTHDDLPWRAK